MSEIYVNTADIKTAAETIRAGDRVVLSGTVYTARDAAHKKIIDLINNDLPLPFPLEGACIYYAGPTPAKPGQIIGSCGPTTSSRMDVFAPFLLDRGLCAMIGKGERSEEVCRAVIRNKAVYLCAVGGAGALAAKCIKECKEIAFPELGCESVKRLIFDDFPLIAAIDCVGGNLFKIH